MQLGMPSAIAVNRFVGVLIALAIALACLNASAGEPIAPTAEDLFREGRALIAKRDYAAACPKLEESLKLDSAPGTLFNLARCYELDGRLASAWRAYGEVADAMAAAHQRERERVARGRIAEIEPRLSFLVVQLGALAAPGKHTRVTLDARELRTAELGQRVPADVGQHVLSVVAEGKRRWEERVRVERDAETVQIQVPLLEEGPPQAVLPAAAVSVAADPPTANAAIPAEAPTAQSTVGEGDDHGLGPKRIVALTLFGSSVVAAGLGTYFGLEAFRLGHESRSGCTPACNPTALSETSDSHTAGDVSTVSFAASGVLAAGGVILWITGPRSVVVSPGVSPRAALWVQGRF